MYLKLLPQVCIHLAHMLGINLSEACEAMTSLAGFPTLFKGIVMG